MTIILLRGFSHSGKDFVGKILKEKYGYQQFSFADSLKMIVSDKYKCDIELLYSQEGKLQICQSDSLRRTYRQILIDEALLLRNNDDDIFTKYCCEKMKQSGYNKFVITDWRYPNELEAISKNFSCPIIPVNIHRINQLESPVKDISEYHLVNRTGDYVVENRMDDSIILEIDKLILHIHNNFLFS